MATPESCQVEINNPLMAIGSTETEIVSFGGKVRLVSGPVQPGCVHPCIRQQDTNVFSWFVLQTTSAIILLGKNTQGNRIAFRNEETKTI